MNPTRQLNALGQSLWLDQITRQHLSSGTLQRYIDKLAVTGLTSNPTIFHKAIKGSADYDDDIQRLHEAGKRGEDLFFDLAITDLVRAADLFVPVYQRSHGSDGFVSLEVSPLLARDTEATQKVAIELFRQAARPNLFIKIPGTPEGIPAIEESIFAGVPVNVTLLFSTDQYLAAAEAYLRGIERRIDAGLSAHVPSVASLFVSRWDVAVADTAPAELKMKLGIAVARQAYRAYVELISTPRCHRIMNAGAQVQRLLMASTGTKDPQARDTLYVEALAAPLTINTMPEDTLTAFAEHGELGDAIPPDGGDCDEVLARFRDAGVDVDALALRLQKEGAESFVKSWRELLEVIETKTAALSH